MASKIITQRLSSCCSISRKMLQGNFVKSLRTEHSWASSTALVRKYSNDPKQLKQSEKSVKHKSKLPGSMVGKFVPFEDEKRIIQDVTESEWDPVEEDFEPPATLVYERGKSGVFDLPELVQLLKEENATDICVVRIPPEMYYADHMIIITTRSPRHMFSLATFVRKRYKSKKLKSSDKIPKLEGNEDSDDWIAIDLGNIILHIFTPETRELYALETLWTVGSQFDDLSHAEDTDIVQLLNLFR